jgi:hypothetical protein
MANSKSRLNARSAISKGETLDEEQSIANILKDRLNMD